jgi:hypothetical protein
MGNPALRTILIEKFFTPKTKARFKRILFVIDSRVNHFTVSTADALTKSSFLFQNKQFTTVNRKSARDSKPNNAATNNASINMIH